MAQPSSPFSGQSAAQHGLTQEHLARDLRQLSLREGDQLIVHASLSQVGWIEGGPDTLIAALQEVIGDGGTLVMPTFNHGAPFSSSGVGYYDPADTPSMSGMLSEHFRHASGVVRSLSPTHPFAAWGKGAADLVDGHEQATTVGVGSPLFKLLEAGGRILHLGTTHQMSTAKHIGELLEQARCLSAPADLFPVRLRRHGREQVHLFPSWRYRAQPCPLTDSNAHLAALLEGKEVVGMVGAARSSLGSLHDVVEATRRLLRRGTEEHPPCSRCIIGPSPKREGDWD